MSRDRRDQRGGHPPRRVGLCRGCPYCRPAKPGPGPAEGEITEQLFAAPVETTPAVLSQHAFNDEHRCVRCGVNDLDADLYQDLTSCSGDRVVYTSESPRP